MITDSLPVALADGLGIMYVVPLNVVPRLFTVGCHQLYESPAFKLRVGLVLNVLVVACDSTCVPTTLKPAG